MQLLLLPRLVKERGLQKASPRGSLSSLNGPAITEKQKGIPQSSNRSLLGCRAQTPLHVGKWNSRPGFPPSTLIPGHVILRKKNCGSYFPSKIVAHHISAVFICGWNDSLLAQLNKVFECAPLPCPLAVLCLSCALLRFRRQGCGRPTRCLHPQEDAGA